MAIFGIDVDNDIKVVQFVNKMQDKLGKPDLFQNPFTGFMRLGNYKGQRYIFTYLDLVWINPTYPTLFLFVALYLAYGFTFHWVELLLLPLIMGSFMFTTLFSKIAMHISLRKFGYKGKIKFLNEREMLLRLANWDNKR